MFTLKESSRNRVIAKFHVLKGEEIVGSIAVAPTEVSALRRCWQGSTTEGAKSNVESALAKAFKPKAVSKQFVLRGC